MDNSPVKRIIQEMQMLYGSAFNAKWGGIDLAEMVAFWERKLQGYTLDELRRGFKALEGLKFPPSLPEFMQLCRPPIDPMKAYHEAVKGVRERREGRKGEWSHPAIFWASSSMAFDLIHKPLSAVESMWKSKLNEELAKTSWPEIPDVPTALPEPPASRAQGQKEYAAALKQYGFQKPEARGNGNWIHKNIKRMKEGWKPTVAVKQAVLDGAKALGIPVPEGV